MRACAWLLGGAICALTLGHLLVVTLQSLGYTYVYGFIGLFHFGYEQNVPTLFNTMLLLLTSMLLTVHWWIERSYRSRWLLVAIVAAMLAVTEFASLHEPVMFVLSGGVSETTAGLRESITVRWMDLAPYLAVALCGLAAFFWPVVRSLSASVLVMAGLAGLVYLAGPWRWIL